MDKKELTQRKITRGKSTRSTTSFFRRRSSTKSVTARLQDSSSPPLSPKSLSMDVDARSDRTGGRDMQSLMEVHVKSQDQLLVSVSVIPEELAELPGWYSKELEWVATSAKQFRAKYPLHNPVGPRWYKNYHLIPASELAPDKRPPSFFSPSFPPMAAIDRSDEPVWQPGPSRTPSGSPLPTPNSSQVKISEPPRGGRSRKTSQTGYHVDLLDGTDPWGTQWHHESPYDVGSPTSGSPDSADGPNKPRSRLPSNNGAPTRHRTVNPSPLSQSTSAVHLAPELPELSSNAASIPRRLSKRRKPGMRNLFGSASESNTDDNKPEITSAPVTPLDGAISSSPFAPVTRGLGRKLSKRGMSLPVTTTLAPPDMSGFTKVDKRTSILGRLVKKFSVARKSRSGHVTDENRFSVTTPGVSMEQSRASSPEKPHLEMVGTERSNQRVAPPTVAQVHQAFQPTHGRQGSGDNQSVLEAQVSMGKLTIANPDTPGSVENTPAMTEVPLPPEKDARFLATPATVHEGDAPLSCILEQFPQVAEPEPVQESEQPVRPPREEPPRPEIHSPPSQLSAESSVPKAPRLVIPTSPAQPEQNLRSPPVYFSPTPIVSSPTPLSPRAPPTSPSPARHSSTSVNVFPSAAPKHSPTLEPPTPASATRPPPVAMPPSSPPTHRPSAPPAQVAVPAPSPVTKPTPPISSPAPLTHNHRKESSSASKSQPAPPPAQPTTSQQSAPLRPPLLKTSSSKSADDSPLSRASMLANPPTPYSPPVPMPSGSVDEPTPKFDAEVTRASPVRQYSDKDKEKEKVDKDKASVRSARQTETFKLIRSPSGNVQSSVETIMANGQTWEVVESAPKRSKSKARESYKAPEPEPSLRKEGKAREAAKAPEPETSSRKESKAKESRAPDPETSSRKESKAKESRAPDPETSSRKERKTRETRSVEPETSSRKESKAREVNGSSEPETSSRKESKTRDSTKSPELEVSARKESKRHERSKSERDGDRARGAERKATTNGKVADSSAAAGSSSSPAPAHVADAPRRPTLPDQSSSHKEHRSDRRRSSRERQSSAPPDQQQVEEPTVRIREKRPSLSARPTSEMSPVADFDAMRAREAWEMERLWKGQSMTWDSDHPPLLHAAPGSQNGSAVNGHAPHLSRATTVHATGVHGSNHTSFMMSSPFQGGTSSSNSYFAVPPAPVIYSPIHRSQTSVHHTSPSYDFTTTFKSHPPEAALSPVSRTSSRPAPPNPLPDPPRESTYHPSPLPTILSDSEGGRSEEYWSKYAGLTTAH
ncbi:hypothetical protein JAAARDRAFT_29372 [Jaapia argillacea MUCL 33604]|uniref:Uncharacterized protein n=1 Tax=Jaapia argillacea MUCL 33604 TaxID=933084 RepID=A0A067Q8N0_9AGAM|nr:hypothetical protein JAAARDRAFT_29372 [Jaapia argillacea MUCL 33604]